MLGSGYTPSVASMLQTWEEALKSNVPAHSNSACTKLGAKLVATKARRVEEENFMVEVEVFGFFVL